MKLTITLEHGDGNGSIAELDISREQLLALDLELLAPAFAVIRNRLLQLEDEERKWHDWRHV